MSLQYISNLLHIHINEHRAEHHIRVVHFVGLVRDHMHSRFPTSNLQLLLSATTYSGSALTSAAPGLCSGWSARTSRIVHAEVENGTLQVGTSSSTSSACAHDSESTYAESVNIPRNENAIHSNNTALRISTPKYHWASAEATCDLIRDDGCLGIDGVVGGTASAAFSTFFGAHPQGHPHQPAHCFWRSVWSPPGQTRANPVQQTFLGWLSQYSLRWYRPGGTL